MMATKPTKCERLLALLSDNKPHGQREVLDAAGFRYTGRIMDLRAQGHDIESIHIGGSEWRFRLVSPAQRRLL